MDNLIVWADIPVTDLDRAMKFYGAVLQREFITMPGMDGVALPGPDEPPGEGAPEGGAPDGPMPVAFDLVKTDKMKPGMDGCQIYLNADEDPEGMLQRAAAPAARSSARSRTWARWSAGSASSRTPRATASACTSRTRERGGLAGSLTLRRESRPPPAARRPKRRALRTPAGAASSARR